MMNVRSHFVLDAELQRRAEEKAAELGISFAEYVRRLVANDLGYAREPVPVSAIFDLGSSEEPTDIARDKDQMVGEAVWDEYLRKTGRKPRTRG